MKITNKDIRFVMFTAIFALLVMGLMHLVVPTPPPKPPVNQAALDLATARIAPINVFQLRNKIATSKKPTLVMIYTSWCPHCRHALPVVLSLKDKGILNNARVLFVSIDKKKEDLAEYLVEEGYQDAFVPYQFKYSERGALMDFMKSKNANFNGGIPYAALFSQQGELIAETDARGWDALLNAIHELNP
jgi:thiol-disulfide isomerase/thioredoxin